jgi:ribosomal protein S18 acetylase RimI-like enzyme
MRRGSSVSWLVTMPSGLQDKSFTRTAGFGTDFHQLQVHSMGNFIFASSELANSFYNPNWRDYLMQGYESKIPRLWETERLELQDSVVDEANELQSIHDACSYLHNWDGEYTLQPNHLHQLITDPPLPPQGGERERFRIQTIRQTEGSQPIGFLAVYEGEPTPDSLYVFTFFIHPDYQGQGYGQEIFSTFFGSVRDAGFKKVTLCTALKNFPAVRFWTKLGFNTIIKVHGDKLCGEDTHAQMDLQMTL